MDVARGQTHSTDSSSSSAIDLTGTPTGLVSSLPPSPALSPHRASFARRRTSWNRVERGQDPLSSFDPLAIMSSSQDTPGPSTPRPLPPPQTPPLRRFSPTGAYVLDEDPFARSADDPFFPSSYDPADRSYVSHPAATSSLASLISSRRESNNSYGSDDDSVLHLTADMSRDPSYRLDGDPERPSPLSATGPSAVSSPTTPVQPRRRTLRYSADPSPLQRTGTRLRKMSERVRRVSLRVVNFTGKGLDDHVRIADVDDDDKGTRSVVSSEKDAAYFVGDVDNDTYEEKQDTLPDLRNTLPLRGRTLGFLGPNNPLRRTMYRFLVYPWTEPVILCLIVFNAIVLTIQASRTLVAGQTPVVVRGYFHTWEDFALFLLFIIFSMEAFARICVTGLVLDPEIPVSSMLHSFTTSPEPSFAASTSAGLVRQPSAAAMHAQSSYHRDVTIAEKLGRLYANITRPFALAHTNSPPRTVSAPASATSSSTALADTHQRPTGRPRADTAKSTTSILEKIEHAHSHLRGPDAPTFVANAFRSDHADKLTLPFKLSVRLSHGKTARNVPYLRHSWSRIDFVAIVAFWITFVLAQTGVEHGTHHVGVFRALSVLRTARLLTITSGTTTIMHSLKTARPLLQSVALFVIFAMVVFSIIGIQAFNGSFRRSCFLQPTLGEDEVQLSQQCGGYIDATTFNHTGYIRRNGQVSDVIKGYICPIGQICKEDQNPESGLESFDTVYFSALQVFIVASANGWSPLMYSMIDAEYFVSCFFFIVCIIVLNYWLLNLFVAVITNTFSAIREETKKSAFGAAPLQPVVDERDEGWMGDRRRITRRNRVREIYEHIRWCWVALALASLVLRATFSADMSSTHAEIVDKGELGLTIAFDVEIIIRVIAHLPAWRGFFSKGQNVLDLVLAIGSTIIEIPAIRNSNVYPWLTAFQLMRFYRVILEIPRMKPLLLSVFGNLYGLTNMTLFLLLINFISALIAVQMLRGDLPSSVSMNFGEIFTSFLATYQVFSSENWTNVLYDSATAELSLGQTALTVLFFVAWFFFANFIVLQMFIAVINENFNVAEESKRGQQADFYLQTQQIHETRTGWLRRLNPYRWFKPSPKAIVVENLSRNLVLPMQKALVQDYGLPAQEREGIKREVRSGTESRRGIGHLTTKSLNALQQLFIGETGSNDVPLATLRSIRKDASVAQVASERDEETERHLELLAAINNEAAVQDDLEDTYYERMARKADFIRNHPTFDKTFWVFSQKNALRKYCQMVVRPAGGERIFGRQPSPTAHTILQLILLLTVIGGIIVESIATPIYRRNYYATHGLVRGSWFDIAESVFGIMLVVEFVIKVIADGFAFTPNAYVRSIWNVLDFFIMCGIIVNVVTGLVFIGGLSRFTRALKALRALRLVTLIEKMRSTFENLIISGASRIFEAALLAILYMIPYAVWGLTIFAGRTNVCNDTSAADKAGCINEYSNSVIGSSGNQFSFPVPRVWENPSPSTTFSFDTFHSSLLILFEIVSLEGWVDVMNVATSITSPDGQPQTNASQVNAIFFLIYNLLGAVVILTLFVSIIIGNFSTRTGSALLTQPQREWIDLQKLIRRQRPSKRPRNRPTFPIRGWCYDRAISKQGWWSRSMTVLFTLHVIVLMSQTYWKVKILDSIRENFFLVVTVAYCFDTTVRFYGLGYRSFKANGWNLFDVLIASGSLFTTISVRVGAKGDTIQQLQKLFLVSIAFKLVQRLNNLNKLFKTAVSSLPVVFSLLALWIILFFFFAILYVEVFSLTKWQSAETRNENYTSIGTALVMLAFMTSGEGWNQYMHDYAIEFPRCTASSLTDPETDCGSSGWSFALFISWNLLSMYIFVNMFTGVVVENFSYVFQITGGSRDVTRQQMRAFKRVWAEYANQKTGYLERPRFAEFFHQLSGIFEVKIYPSDQHYQNILSTCKVQDEPETAWQNAPIVEGVNLKRLSQALDEINFTEIRNRRNLYSRIYHEAIITHEQGKGIQFTDMLILLAHHKLIVDKDALVLKDLLVRTRTNDLVTDLVNIDRVRSLLRTIAARRRFLAHLEQRRRRSSAVPEIIVDDFPTTPTQDITATNRRSVNLSPFRDGELSPTLADQWGDSDLSLNTRGSPRASRLQRMRRTSDMSVMSADLGVRHTRDLSPFRDSTYGEDPQDLLSSIQNSSWGAVMLEAEQDERDHGHDWNEKL